MRSPFNFEDELEISGEKAKPIRRVLGTAESAKLRHEETSTDYAIFDTPSVKGDRNAWEWALDLLDPGQELADPRSRDRAVILQPPIPTRMSQEMIMQSPTPTFMFNIVRNRKMPDLSDPSNGPSQEFFRGVGATFFGLLSDDNAPFLTEMVPFKNGHTPKCAMWGAEVVEELISSMSQKMAPSLVAESIHSLLWQIAANLLPGGVVKSISVRLILKNRVQVLYDGEHPNQET